MPSVSSSRAHTCSRSRLVFARAPGGPTFLASQAVCYPLHVTTPFMLAERPLGMATLYLQSVSGGLYDDDDLGLALRCGEHASAHVTTQSPEVVHRARSGGARLRVDIDVGTGALFEYLPDPVVMFPGARLRSVVEARVADGATLLLCDGLLAHDPAGDARPFDNWDSHVRIVDARGRPLLQERLLLDGERHLGGAARRGGLGRSQATLVLASPGVDPGPLLDAARAAIADAEDVYAGASTLPHDAGVIVRIAAAGADRLAASMHAAWSALRIALTGAAPASRRK